MKEHFSHTMFAQISKDTGQIKMEIRRDGNE